MVNRLVGFTEQVTQNSHKLRNLGSHQLRGAGSHLLSFLAEQVTKTQQQVSGVY